MPAFTREEADLELLLLQSEADSTTDSDLFVWLDTLGLPVEVNLKLQWLIGETRKIGDKVISVGKIILMKIRQFVEENPNLAIGTAIGAAIGVLLNAIPFLGPLLAPIAVVVATPVGWVAGSAVVGAGVAYGISRLIHGAAYSEAKRKQLIRDIEARIADIERKEAASSVTASDKENFYHFLSEPLRRNLISPEHVWKLMKGIENGTIKLRDAYRSIDKIAKSNAGSERC